MSDYDIDYIGGNCPVQADVTIYREGEAERYGYFRARGASWSFEIYPPGVERDAELILPAVPPEWETDASWGVWPEAGWMEDEQARDLIAWAIGQWQNPDPLRPPPSFGPIRPADGHGTPAGTHRRE